MTEGVGSPRSRVLFGWLGASALTALLVLLALALGAGSQLLAVATILLLLLLPGMALLRVLAPGWDGDPIDSVGLSVGLSLAGLPLLLAWMTWLGGYWTPARVVALLVLSTGVAGGAWWLRSRGAARPSGSPIRARSSDLLTALLLMLVLAAALWLRLDHVRDVLMPAWSDSYQHVMVSKLIMDGGRVPDNYGPLIGLASFRYHFGFHTLVAFWGWLSGMAPHVAVLWTGQVVNALTPLTLYFFMAYGLKDRRAGIIGAVITGLLTISPANHVNFGRFPQLSGQVLLPVAMGLTLRTLWAKEGEHRPWLLAAVTTAGLCLIHYRVVLFYACFVVANLLVLALIHRGDSRQLWLILLETGRLAALSLLLVAPWMVHVASISGQQVAIDAVFAESDDYHHLSWAFVMSWSVPAPLLVGAALGAAWALLRRAWRVVALVVWVILLFLLSSPRLLGLPTTLVTSGSVVLALYVPVGMLGGYLASQALQALARCWGQRAANLALAAMVLVGSLAGLHYLNRRILEPWRFFVTPDDLQAYAWIREHLPEESFFAAQARQGISPLLMHGVDGGYWVPYMTGRRSTLPPMPYVSELSIEAADPINRRALDTGKLPHDHEALARLRAEGVTHVYVVEPRGDGMPGLWQPEEFAADPEYCLLYHEGTVWIFALEGVR